MNRPILKVAVVGHTNTGKTSLMRTLMRDVDFGEVSPHPAVTRHVEGAGLLVDGRIVIELYDTPGLEDSIGLLEYLESKRTDRRTDGVELIEWFLNGEEPAIHFAQEAKAIRQLMACDAALYVIDARDRVLAKHRDELTILGFCAKPIVPVLNFVAGSDARINDWRAHLSRNHLHAVAEFDTVIYDATHEYRLYEKMRSLLDKHHETLDALIEDRKKHRAILTAAAGELIAELLVDAASFSMIVPHSTHQNNETILNRLRQAIRQREEQCTRDLLELFQFRPDIWHGEELPQLDGHWGTDLFSPEAMKQFSLHTGSAAAAGAFAGLIVDSMTGWLIFGAATAVGAGIGALIGAGRTHGRNLMDRIRGMTELRCDDNTLRLLTLRQLRLVRVLLHTGHAGASPITPQSSANEKKNKLTDSVEPVIRLLHDARIHRNWSRIDAGSMSYTASDTRRQAMIADLGGQFERQLTDNGNS